MCTILRRRTFCDDDVPTRKWGHPRKSDSPLSSRYPVMQGDILPDPVSEKDNTDALAKEMERDHSRKEILLPSMKSLFIKTAFHT